MASAYLNSLKAGFSPTRKGDSLSDGKSKKPSRPVLNQNPKGKDGGKMSFGSK